jgi:hypothetical protein
MKQFYKNITINVTPTRLLANQNWNKICTFTNQSLYCIEYKWHVHGRTSLGFPCLFSKILLSLISRCTHPVLCIPERARTTHAVMYCTERGCSRHLSDIRMYKVYPNDKRFWLINTVQVRVNGQFFWKGLKWQVSWLHWISIMQSYTCCWIETFF